MERVRSTRSARAARTGLYSRNPSSPRRSRVTGSARGGTLGYLIDEPERRLWATNADDLAPLVDAGLALFGAFRAAIAGTPLPALARPGRISAKWRERGRCSNRRTRQAAAPRASRLASASSSTVP
jgi:hypothetical protein